MTDLDAIRAAASRLNQPMMDRLRRCSWDRSPNWAGAITIYPPEARGLIDLIDAMLPRTTPAVTINCAGNGGRAGVVHRAREDDPAKTRYLFPLCPDGTVAAERGRIVYEATGRAVTCPKCLDALAGV